MADSSYVKSLFGGVASDIRLAADKAFTYVLANLRFGAVAHQTRATNFQAYYVTGTTSTTANQEFSIAHGLGRTPTTAFPVIPLDAVGAKLVAVTMSRAADAHRIYFTSASTAASVAFLVE